MDDVGICKSFPAPIWVLLFYLCVPYYIVLNYFLALWRNRLHALNLLEAQIVPN